MSNATDKQDIKKENQELLERMKALDREGETGGRKQYASARRSTENLGAQGARSPRLHGKGVASTQENVGEARHQRPARHRGTGRHP